MVKLILDIFFAFFGLIVLIPLFIVLILVSWIVEQKKPFFLQYRVGKNKKEFKIYKFRTMTDGEITKIGRVLRKTGIDELPQLINIVKAEMSFVGPRPLTVNDIKRLGWDIPFYTKRWKVKPGIVGLAQLSPVCNKKMSWFYDQLYIKKESIFLDFKILSAAIIIPFVGKKKVKNWIHGKQ